MFNPRHFALFFTREHVQTAARQAQQEPFRSAWSALEACQVEGAAKVQLEALRYCLRSDENAAVNALHGLERAIGESHEAVPYLNGVMDSIILMQSFEMLREHRTCSPGLTARMLDWVFTRVGILNEQVYNLQYVESAWLGLLNLCAGIVLEREAIFEHGVSFFHQAIGEDISPRGHIEPITKNSEGSVMEQTILAVEALVMMAEAASHVGINLWDYHVRGVSVTTAAIYPIYYFYTTEKWSWETIEPEVVQAAFRRHGGYLEVVNRRLQPRDFKPLLEDLRPMIDPGAGGLPTLTHGIAKRRGLFG